MAKLAIKKASTDVSVYLFIQDSSKTTGVGLTGLAYNTASLVASYVRPLKARAAITLATQTVTGAHSDGGFVEIDSTNMPGVYRFDLPDAVCATGVGSVVVMLQGASNMAPCLLELQLLTNDPNDIATATALTTVDTVVDAVKAKTDNLPASPAAVGSAMTLSTAYDKAKDDVLTPVTAIKAKTDNLPASPAAVGSAMVLTPAYDKAKDDVLTPLAVVDGNVDDIKTAISTPDNFKADVSGLPAAVWGYATRTVTSFGTLIADIWAYATRTLSAFGFTVSTNSDANVTAIKAKTDNLPASPAAVGSAMTLADEAITASGLKADAVTKIQNGLSKPGTPQTITPPADMAKDSTVAKEATVGALNDLSAQQVWEYVTRGLSAPNDYKADVSGLAPANEYDTELAAIQADLNNPAQYKADVSALALEATLSAIKGAGWTNETLLSLQNTLDAINVLSAADIRTAIGIASANLDAQLTAIQTDLDNPNQYKANVSGLAPAHEYDTELSAIQADLNNPNQYKADVSALALEATLTDLKGIGWTDESLVAIKAVLDGISALDAAGIRAAIGLASANLDTQLGAIQTDLDNPDQYKANVSGLAPAHEYDTELVAIKAKTDDLTFTTPKRVDASATVDAQEVADAIEPLIPTAANIWKNVDRTLTMSAAEVIACVTGSSITVVRGNTWDIELTDVTLDGNKQQFAVKRSPEQSDDAAILLIDSSVGLLRVDGKAVTEDENSKAQLTYIAGEKKLIIHLDADVSAKMPAKSCVYGVQSISSVGAVVEPYIGDFVIVADVFRATE